MRGVTGNPYDTKYGNIVSGKDSLIVNVFMKLSELKEILKSYLNAYFDKRYQTIGFSWIDNIGEVRDAVLCNQLDKNLIDDILSKSFTHLYAAPPDIIDWEHIRGFCFSGMGKNKDKEDSYDMDFDIVDYINYIHKIKYKPNILEKIKRDRLYAITSAGEVYSICSVYSSIVFQTTVYNETYILYAGNWYIINNNFFQTVVDYVDKIPISSIPLPDCKEKVEKDYNLSVEKSDSKYCLMDRKLVFVVGAPKQIEACDIFTDDKQFIHIKFKSKSAQISHLFSQGKVSAQCFLSDEMFRKQILDMATKKFGKTVFNYRDKPKPYEYEVVFVIIDKKVDKISKRLPFFSLVNLMLTAQELERMNMKYSIKIVKKV